jgi:aminomethyltransferase
MAYTVMCNDSGGAIDDLAVYCLAPQDYLLVINASRATHDLSWIRDHATRTDAGDVTIVDRTPGEAMIAVQGPEAEALVAATIGPESKELGFFRCLTMTTEQGEWLVSRSGYTGEDGFEIICPAPAARDLWQQLQRGGGRPAGLAARDTLRLEAGLCLYGNELSEQITPLEAGLEWTLALDKETDFPGREALRLQRQKGVRRRLLGLRLLTRGIPRAQQSVVDGARPVGEITSGTHSPVLKQGIAMAYVDEAHADCGHRLQVVGRGGGLEAEVVELPFVPSRVKRRRKKEQQKKGSAT